MQGPRPELNFRARKILYAVISEYIATGEPVGSRKLARRYGLNLSPASIRNVLADLEDAGYLVQPHTSAGRVPTVVGFRVFVDALVQTREVSSEDRAAVITKLRAMDRSSDDVIREAGRMLSNMTGAAAVIASPHPSDERLEQLRFMPLRPGEVLAVIVTASGIQNRVVPVADDVSLAVLERVHNYLVPLLEGRTLAQVREVLVQQMAAERGHYAELQRSAKEMVDATLSTAEPHGEVLIEGQGVLFDRPEFTSAEKIRAFLRAFEEKQALLELLERTMVSGGFQVLIGNETRIDSVDDISVISANYTKGGAGTGALGLIGPARMDYARLVPLVGYTARKMSELLDGNDDLDDSEDD